MSVNRGGSTYKGQRSEVDDIYVNENAPTRLRLFSQHLINAESKLIIERS